MKKNFLIGTVLLVVIISGTAYFALTFFTYQSPLPVTLEIKKGASLRAISTQLAKENIIPNAMTFEFLARLLGKQNEIKSGEYEFSKGLSPLDILNLMARGEIKLHPLTIPEGYNLQDIGKLLMAKKITTAEEWTGLTLDKDLLKQIQPKPPTLEGYLFPETYHIPRETAAKEIIGNMLAEFNRKISADKILQAQKMGLTLNQWVTLASIVEKETGVPAERPLIAALFLNRLKKGMPLQSDPTVIYGIQNFNGNLTRTDLATDTPYNTYTRPGLPPGPIASPGLDSLLAILNPAPTEFLYFVAKGNGTHYFSKTLAEHNRAVQYYQLGNGIPPGEPLPE